MKDKLGFRYTPQPRPLSDAEVNEFGLKYNDGSLVPCVYQGTDIVWSAAGTEDDTWYRLYNRGTNDLLVLKFKPSVGKWEKSHIRAIPNLYGFIWKMVGKMEAYKRDAYKLKSGES